MIDKKIVSFSMLIIMVGTIAVAMDLREQPTDIGIERVGWNQLNVIYDGGTNNIAEDYALQFNGTKFSENARQTSTIYLRDGSVESAGSFDFGTELSEVLVITESITEEEIGALFVGSATEYTNNNTIGNSTHGFTGFIIDARSERRIISIDGRSCTYTFGNWDSSSTSDSSPSIDNGEDVIQRSDGTFSVNDGLNLRGHNYRIVNRTCIME